MKPRSINKFTRSISHALTEMFAPTCRCVVCGKDVFDATSFCADCSKDVIYNNGKTCKRCGVGIDGEEDYCENCAFDKIYFDKAYSVFSYEGAVQKAILAMKFNNLGTHAKAFAPYLVFMARNANLDYDIVTFAPMSRKSLRKRRYNQAQLLAKYFCNLQNKDELLVEAIVKHKETEAQEQLDKAQRKTNLIGAYKINADVKGKRVLVIDDVKTTGATLNECAKVLKRAGATAVYGLTVASRKEHFQYE
ncbi:MAG: ComF family protein [Clostridiales bacterium]|nr:ComF family protein [Clostridiales bacterium]